MSHVRKGSDFTCREHSERKHTRGSVTVGVGYMLKHAGTGS
jgi:hypothetical protein